MQSVDRICAFGLFDGLIFIGRILRVWLSFEDWRDRCNLFAARARVANHHSRAFVPLGAPFRDTIHASTHLFDDCIRSDFRYHVAVPHLTDVSTERCTTVSAAQCCGKMRRQLLQPMEDWHDRLALRCTACELASSDELGAAIDRGFAE